SPKKPITARKSFPANAANITEPHVVVAGTRKSLPASAKLLTANEKNEPNEVEDELPESDQSNGSVEEIVEVEECPKVSPTPSPDKKNTQNESLAEEVTLDQPANDVSNTGRKSMPPVSLISAQFYIGAAKKRNTIGGGDMNAMTSTPKQPQNKPATTEKNKKAKGDGTSVVPNPFALAKGGKLKSRSSLDSGATVSGVQQQEQVGKKARLSMPPKLIEEDSPSKTVPASQEPEPMEVDEVPEEENVANGEEAEAQPDGETTEEDDDDDDDNDDSVQEVVQSDVKQRTTKVPKPKVKALEDYDLANILVRCNEFVREDKERKKQLASVLRKKKDEKKKQRELEKQQELEAAKAAAANASATDKDDPNSTNATTTNDSTGGQGEDSLKKKKKRKPKKVNYLLEELAETKKERMDQALRRKLEVIERRKQRKKERLLEKKKQQDKENGHNGADKVPTVAASGIGAKLEKMKRNKKTKKQEKEPAVRVALSAFAVFHQNPTNEVEVPLPSVAAEDGVQSKSNESSLGKKQALKTTELETKTKKPVHSDEKTPTESPNAKKKQTVSGQPEEALAVTGNASDTMRSHQSAADGLPKDVAKLSKKQKKKLATATKISNGESELRNEIVEVMAESAEPTVKVEKPKEKKIKEQATELTLNEADAGTVPKQKKSKKIKQAVAAEEKLATSAMDELRHAEVETVSTAKKTNKKLASQTISGVPEAAVVPAKKRKREQQADSSSVVSTPRPAKHTKLRVLQRIESGGFFEESVTPDKLRMKRNFGFDERQATPAKQLGFRVSSLLPTGQDELRDMAAWSKKSTKDGGRKTSKFGEVVATVPNASLPLPVWTSSGVFLESAINGSDDSETKKKAQTSKPNSSTTAESGYIQLKTQGKGDFTLKKLRPGPNAQKPHRVDSTTTAQSVLNFKRQQLLEKTAHLRDKKKSHRV
uniref:Uncharacterized protein n=1 Tax=Anopheles maculatus TaxID=74869 RepID=A0A182SPR3_9DIPT